ncbi:MAG: ATP-binding cassette domain-containing protein [Phycisphaerae bacterium]|jgi:ABC-2 type transport system ATP-binding protein
MNQNDNFAIETFSLSKVFSDLWGRMKVYAVNELNLQIRYNEVYGLLGPNGSGKTTTIKLLLGLLYPTKGRTLMLGGSSTDPKISARIGFLPEESYLYKYLTARETLDFYGRLFSLPRHVRKARIEALLEMVGLKAVANRQVGTFSKGMARRIGLAQALINDPDLLILDEPTTGLDPIGTRQIKDLIIELGKRGKTVLLCSHLLADVEDICDRISILYGGRIQAEGQVRQLLQQSNKVQITSDALSSSTIENIEKLIESENVEYEVSSPMEKLETYFIRTVTKAQEGEVPTSGAVSTTMIGDFLAAEASQKSILDKLVTAQVSDTNKEEVPSADKLLETKTEKPVRAETSPDEPNEDVLSELTSGPKVVKPVEKPEPARSEPAEAEKVRDDILEQLTNKPKETKEQNDNNTQQEKPDA